MKRVITMNAKSKVNILAIATVILWASAFPFSKVAMEHFSPNSLGCLRITAASIFLILLGIFSRLHLPRKKDIYKFFLSGALGFTLYMLTFNVGIRTLTSATSSIIMAMTPVMTAVGALFIYREKIPAIGWISIGIEFIGILVLTLWDGVLSLNVGILWTLSTAILFCGYNLYQRKLLSQGYTPLEITIFSITAGAILFLPFLPNGIHEMSKAPLSHILVVIYLGVFPNAIAAFTWGKALLIAKKTSDVTNFMFVTPLLATIMGFVVLKESPSAGTIAGGIIILIGLRLFQKKQKGTCSS